jgi:hypothetical protein
MQGAKKPWDNSFLSGSASLRETIPARPAVMPCPQLCVGQSEILLVAQGVDWIELGGLAGRVIAEEHPDGGTDDKSHHRGGG